MPSSAKKKWQRPMLRIHKRAEVDRWLQDATCRCDPAYPNCRTGAAEANLPPCLRTDEVPFGPAPSRN